MFDIEKTMHALHAALDGLTEASSGSEEAEELLAQVDDELFYMEELEDTDTEELEGALTDLKELAGKLKETDAVFTAQATKLEMLAATALLEL